MSDDDDRCPSSVVEHRFGKAEVESSILSGSTIYTPVQQARFWSNVDIPNVPRSLNLCWPWKLSLNQDYGQVRIGRRITTSSRVAYEIFNGPIPRGMQILHSCDNPRCCNPQHLRVGTHAENMNDKRERGRVWYGGPRKKEPA